MAKFKPGDYIRIWDKEDIAYECNHYYIIIDVLKDGYIMKSGQHGGMIDPGVLRYFLEARKYKNMMECIDSDYRLLTDAEKVLHGKT